ncbi:MAG: ribonuclease P protein subunit [Candidatus Nezhaarchaeota archaeon]|nr:ribonuclease P protein subunit [Candidatus Nezhaarchaeota archaeon]MCX8141768.1 ribonuclease P protein subunit [Candidatus Nezhaarchaeota archaeon]MDW8050454.1 ribonuclease P protein subunit [Nitrososphaerota archaeon]
MHKSYGKRVMPITPQTILNHELIGLRVKVVKATHQGYVGIEGIVVDETMKTLKIMDGIGNMKTVPKNCCVFRFMLPNGTIVEVEGNYLIGRPEDRVKRITKKRW